MVTEIRRKKGPASGDNGVGWLDAEQHLKPFIVPVDENLSRGELVAIPGAICSWLLMLPRPRSNSAMAMLEICGGGLREWPTGYTPRSKTAMVRLVDTAKDALAKLAELAESDQIEVAAMDLSGTIIELATLQAKANQAP